MRVYKQVRESGHTHRAVPLRREILDRLRTVEGHLQAVQRMVDRQAHAQALHQVIALRAALHSVGALVMRDHILTCLSRSGEEVGQEILPELMTAVTAFAPKR